MPINNASVPIGGVYTPAGGVATSIVSLGSTIDSNKFYINGSEDLILRKTILATSKSPSPSSGAPNGYTQQRTAVVVHVPMLLDNGNYTTNTIRVEISYDPEADSDERAYLREWLSHMGSDADFDLLFYNGSVA